MRTSSRNIGIELRKQKTPCNSIGVGAESLVINNMYHLKLLQNYENNFILGLFPI
jgi:nitrate reductase beta subunit